MMTASLVLSLTPAEEPAAVVVNNAQEVGPAEHSFLDLLLNVLHTTLADARDFAVILKNFDYFLKVADLKECRFVVIFVIIVHVLLTALQR